MKPIVKYEKLPGSKDAKESRLLFKCIWLFRLEDSLYFKKFWDRCIEVFDALNQSQFVKRCSAGTIIKNLILSYNNILQES